MGTAAPPISSGGDTDLGERAAPPVQALMAPDPAQTGLSRLAPPASSGRELITRLDYLRIWVQGLRTVLHLIQAGKADLEGYTDYIQETMQQIEIQLTSISIESHNDTTERIIVLWDQMQCNKLLKPKVRLDTQRQLQLIEQLDQQCREMAFWCAYQTVLERIRSWLKQTMPGYAIPFHEVFKDEIPDGEDRQRMLDILALMPTSLTSAGGLVDPERGVVYRYEPDEDIRRKALWQIGLALVAATVVVWVLSILPPLAQTGAGLATLLIGWGAVLVGVLVHVGVDQSKRLRTPGANPAVLPVSRIEMVISVQQGPILLRIAMMLVGYFTLVYSIGAPTPGQDANFLLSAFLAGYSLDSIIDLFSASANQQAAAQQANLKQKLGVT